MTTRISSVILAAFAVFFLSFAAFAQEAPTPKPNPVCVTIDDVLAEHGNKNMALPYLRFQPDPEKHPNITVLGYDTGYAVAVMTDGSGCIVKFREFYEKSFVKPKETGA